MTFRQIDISELRSRPPVARVRPDLQWIDIADIVIDERYQRPLARHNMVAIQKIADAFDWAEFTACSVAPVEGGRFALIDGQHRTHAAALVGETAVPCLVNALDLQAQSRAFAGVNGRVTAISVFHIYKAALTAGDAWALAAKACVERAGCTLMQSNASTKDKVPGQVYCIGLVRRLIDRGQARVLGMALRAIRASQSGADIALYQPPFLQPLTAVLIDNPAFQGLDMAAFLDDCSATTLHRAVDSLRDLPAYGRRSHQSLMVEAMRVRIADWAKNMGRQTRGHSDA